MQDYTNILLAKLHDIHGLHGISIWPLASGWWILIFILAVATILVLRKLERIRKYRKSWRYRLERELLRIVENEDATLAKKNISRINNVLKRLSMQEYGREETASLTGRKWLAFLTNRDPKNFNWLKKGEMLIEYPYMPEERVMKHNDEIAALAKATKSWLRINV